MRNDYLGRTLTVGDLVVVKHNQYHPMECGLIVGDNIVRTTAGIREHPDYMALIANPDAKELEIKRNIQDMIAREHAAVASGIDPKKASLAEEVGRIYRLADSNQVAVYCGKKKMKLIINGSDWGTTTGRYYMVLGNLDDSVVASMTWDDCVTAANDVIHYNENHKVRKVAKKYAKAYHTVDVPEKFVVEHIQLNGFGYTSSTRTEFSNP
jgi:hypothetical protein